MACVYRHIEHAFNLPTPNTMPQSKLVLIPFVTTEAIRMCSQTLSILSFLFLVLIFFLFFILGVEAEPDKRGDDWVDRSILLITFALSRPHLFVSLIQQCHFLLSDSHFCVCFLKRHNKYMCSCPSGLLFVRSLVYTHIHVAKYITLPKCTLGFSFPPLPPGIPYSLSLAFRLFLQPYSVRVHI